MLGKMLIQQPAGEWLLAIASSVIVQNMLLIQCQVNTGPVALIQLLHTFKGSLCRGSSVS